MLNQWRRPLKEIDAIRTVRVLDGTNEPTEVLKYLEYLERCEEESASHATGAVCTTAVYEECLMQCRKAGLSYAFTVLNKMEQNAERKQWQRAPRNETYRLFSDVDDDSVKISIMERVEKQNVEMDNPKVTPWQSLYTSVLEIFVNKGTVNDVMGLLQRMERQKSRNNRRVVIDCSVCNQVIRSCLRHSDLEDALKVLDSMTHAGMSNEPLLMPTNTSFTLILEYCAQRGIAEQALATLAAMHALRDHQTQMGPTPDVHPLVVRTAACNLAMAACRSSRRLADAVRVLATMEEAAAEGSLEMEPSLDSYNIVLGIAADAGRTQVALNLLRSMEVRAHMHRDVQLQPNNDSFLCTLRTCVHTHSDASASNVFDRMLVLAALPAPPVRPDVQALRLTMEAHQHSSLEQWLVSLFPLLNRLLPFVSNDPASVDTELAYAVSYVNDPTAAASLLDTFSTICRPPPQLIRATLRCVHEHHTAPRRCIDHLHARLKRWFDTDTLDALFEEALKSANEISVQ